MKKFLKIFIPLIILGGSLYFFRDTIKVYIEPSLNNAINNINTGINVFISPCDKSITYSIGSFDSRFGISQKYFLSALSDAEMIWEKPFGKELFTYISDTGSLKVNLVYDYRQEATNRLASEGIIVKDDKASYDALKLKFTSLNNELLTTKNDYENQVKIFNEKQQAYEQQVKYWNDQGGAPKKEYDALQIQKSELDTEAAQLKILQDKVNKMVDDINALVVLLNHLVNVLNLSVDKYNTISGARGESFEEGVYQSDGINKKIDIYEFSSRDKLVRVLAHELGHALGLEHVDDPKAIMYKFNQGNNQILTNADLSALKIHCGVK